MTPRPPPSILYIQLGGGYKEKVMGTASLALDNYLKVKQNIQVPI